VGKQRVQWRRERYADRYRLVWGQWQIVAIALGHDERRSYYVVKRNGKTIDECDLLADAKRLVDLEVST